MAKKQTWDVTFRVTYSERPALKTQRRMRVYASNETEAVSVAAQVMGAEAVVVHEIMSIVRLNKRPVRPV